MTSPHSSLPLKPVAVACAGIAIYSGMDAIMKSLSIELGAYNALLWRTICGVVLLAPLFALRVRRIPDRHTMFLHLGRSIAGSISVLLFFWGLVRVPLAQGIALSFIAPLIALGLASLFLKERIGKRAVSGSLFAFAGVMVILAGQSGAGSEAGSIEGAIAILVASVLYAVNLVIGRRQSLHAGPIEVALAFNLIAACMYLFVVTVGARLYMFASPADADAIAANWLPHLPDPTLWPMIILAAIVGAGAIMLLSWAYARAEAQRLVAVEYTAFIWAVLLGWWVFGEHVLPTTLLGAAMIVAGCLWAARQLPAHSRSHAEPEPIP
jgi:S-adenosylmethionine uptake transporter